VAEFYLDHNVAVGTATYLRDAGHGARTAASLSLERAHDHRHLLEAAQRGWTLVTYNWKDYRLLHDAWRDWPRAWGLSPVPQHAGVLVIPAAGAATGRWTASVAAEQLAAFAEEHPSLTNTLYRWFPGSGWVRF
jgi:hypothetical protein